MEDARERGYIVKRLNSHGEWIALGCLVGKDAKRDAERYAQLMLDDEKRSKYPAKGIVVVERTERIVWESQEIK